MRSKLFGERKSPLCRSLNNYLFIDAEMRARMRSLLLLTLLLSPQMLACKEIADEGYPPDLQGCVGEAEWARDPASWNEMETLGWDHPLPVQDTYKDFSALSESVEGTYDVAYGSVQGTLKVLRSESLPFYTYYYHCSKMFTMPVTLELTEGGKTWKQTADLWVADEHLGYTDDRETPEPHVYTLLTAVSTIDDVDAFPSFGVGEEIPTVREGEKRAGFFARVEIVPNGKVSVEVNASETVKGGPAAGGMYDNRPWFTIEGDLKD